MKGRLRRDTLTPSQSDILRILFTTPEEVEREEEERSLPMGVSSFQMPLSVPFDGGWDNYPQDA